MKIPALVLIAFYTLVLAVAASPDHRVDVTERILGSNSSGFAVLRMESDNLCSHYSYRTTTWLDETPKTLDGREKVKSTLLLDVTHTVDIEHKDLNTPATVAEEINSQDKTLNLASVLQRYQAQVDQPWTPEQLSTLEIHPVAGIHFRGKLELRDGTFIREKVFGGRQGEASWMLKEVMEDGDAIYLKLSIENESGDETRIVCVPPNVTKQLRDQASAQPVYLISGKFGTLEEALKAAASLVTKAKEMEFVQFRPEIWSFVDGTLKTQFVIAEMYSTEQIEANRVPEIEKALEIRLTPMSSGRFIEKFFVSN